jgi:hypothetical protein
MVYAEIGLGALLPLVFLQPANPLSPVNVTVTHDSHNHVHVKPPAAHTQVPREVYRAEPWAPAAATPYTADNKETGEGIAAGLFVNPVLPTPAQTTAALKLLQEGRTSVRPVCIDVSGCPIRCSHLISHVLSTRFAALLPVHPFTCVIHGLQGAVYAGAISLLGPIFGTSSKSRFVTTYVEPAFIATENVRRDQWNLSVHQPDPNTKLQ